MTLRKMLLELDEDDYRDINRAVAIYQKNNRWPDGGVLLPDGDSEMPGSVIGEICRGWMERHQ